MSKIRIKNFGPIKEGYNENDGWLDIKKVTVFIGNQGSGKSTVAKLISTFTWMEKALTRGDYDKKAFQNTGVLKRYLAYHKIANYFRHDSPDDRLTYGRNFPDESVIEYIGDSYSFKYYRRYLKISENQSGNYPLPQIMYLPADRNFISSVDDLKTQRIFSAALSELLYEFDNSKKEMKGDLRLPINEVDLEYDKENDILFLKGDGYKIKLAESSSGFQSFVPLFLVTWFLTNSVKNQAENKEPMSSDELNRFKRGVTDIYSNNNLTDEQKRTAISALSGRFNKSAFINIVEEPEQNLFPTSQWQMLKSLLQFNNMNGGNKLIMTTHSPYIINYLTLAVKGFLVEEKIKDLGNEEELNSKLASIIPLNSVVKPDDLAIYELDDNGGIIKLGDYNGLPSDNNYLNNNLSEGNNLFASILDIEDELEEI
ncbi:AAA family ATPase [Mucilaginibacter sp.]|uniref:AAA family ATPase n=1 Tax=Mucilaginibacter sp. TaxID=1882438 RepID=UPI002845B581|nr:AAA family ATPase [Mucilaginibacter sp.]MDR3693723.1 AAA family ATPase [Mucilaginibacter sp.]